MKGHRFKSWWRADSESNSGSNSSSDISYLYNFGQVFWNLHKTVYLLEIVQIKWKYGFKVLIAVYGTQCLLDTYLSYQHNFRIYDCIDKLSNTMTKYLTYIRQRRKGFFLRQGLSDPPGSASRVLRLQVCVSHLTL